MIGMAIASAAAPIVGGLIGNLMGASDRKKAQQMMKKAVAELQAAGFPPDQSKEIIFKEFESAGILTPQMEEDVQVAASEVAQLQEDPILRNIQLEALNVFKQQGRTGFGPEERAAFNQMRQSQQTDVEAKRQQILSDARRSGMGGSGASLVAQLQASQSGADRASMEGDRLASMMAERIRSGASSMADVSSGIRSQDFQAEMSRRQAQDERNRFLAENSISRQRANIDRANSAQAVNLAERQRIQDANMQLANAEKLRQVDAQRQYWADKMDRASALSNAYTGQANNLRGQAQQTQQMFQGIGTAAGTGIAGYAQNKQDTAMNYAKMTPAQRAEYDKKMG